MRTSPAPEEGPQPNSPGPRPECPRVAGDSTSRIGGYRRRSPSPGPRRPEGLPREHTYPTPSGTEPDVRTGPRLSPRSEHTSHRPSLKESPPHPEAPLRWPAGDRIGASGCGGHSFRLGRREVRSDRGASRGPLRTPGSVPEGVGYVCSRGSPSGRRGPGDGLRRRHAPIREVESPATLRHSGRGPGELGCGPSSGAGDVRADTLAA